jgi:hypothetical protein
MDTKYITHSTLAIATLFVVLFSCQQQQQSVLKTEDNLSEKSKTTETTHEDLLVNPTKKEVAIESIDESESEAPESYSKDLKIVETTSHEEEKAVSEDKFRPEISATSVTKCTTEGAALIAPGLSPTYMWTAATPTYTGSTTLASPTSIATPVGTLGGEYKLDGDSEIRMDYAPAAEPAYRDDISETVKSMSEPILVNTALTGKLTAGEINDFKKWKMWEDYSEPQLAAYRSVWMMGPGERYSVLVQTESGAPLVDCIAELVAKSGEVIWQTRTDNTGKAELWGAFQDAKSSLVVDKIVVYHNNKPYKIERPKTFEKSINSIKIPATCYIPDEVDICFTVDATGSMGDEIAYLQAELLDVIGKIKTQHKDIQLNLGSVFYRDHGDTYLTRNSAFSKDVDITNRFISEQYADGGGDGPEAVDEALRASLFDMTWSKEARARILFMILDAPPHQEKANLILLDNCVREAAKKGVRIIPLVASGGGYDMDKSMEYLMRCCALGTNGTYAFLTNHSGIGGEHTAPSTDHYDVETLNAMLLRIVGEYLTVPDCNLQTFVENEAPLDTVNVVSMIEPAPLDSLQNTADTSNQITDPEPREIVVISCYPNPASDNIWVKTSDDVSELFLTDNSGKIMQRLTPVSRLFEMDLSYYPSGIYYIKAFIRDEWVTARIIVARMK